MKRIQMSAVCMALVLATSGCASTATSGNSSNGNGGNATSKPTEVEPTPSFSQDILFDGVAHVSQEVNDRIDFAKLDVPNVSDHWDLPADSVAPQRCEAWANILGDYGKPSSNERLIFNGAFYEGVWLNISAARTSFEYRQELVDTIDSCSSFASSWLAPTIWNGLDAFETSEYKVSNVGKREPDYLQVSFDAVIGRQVENEWFDEHCLDLFGPGCIAYQGGNYQMYLVSKGEYTISIMFETLNFYDELKAPSPGVKFADMKAIAEAAKDFLDSNT